MKLDHDTGTVEVGKRADLVIVDGDPLASISDNRWTRFVVTAGRVYDCASCGKVSGSSPEDKSCGEYVPMLDMRHFSLQLVR